MQFVPSSGIATCMRAMCASVVKRMVSVSLLAAAALALPHMAQAQNVLMLETSEAAGDALEALSNLQAEFINAGATVVRQDILSTAGAVTPAIFTASPGPYDIVLVATVYNSVDASNWNAIDAAIASRAANSFVMFVDGCCHTAANIGRMRTGLAAASGFALTAGADQGARDNFPLNTNSLYQGFFTASLPQINGGWTQYIAGVPTANALYLPAGTVAMPAVGSTTSAYGLFLPITQSYAGAGACVFAVNDISPFDTGSYPANQRKMATAFLGAAGPGGACGLAASVRKTFAPTTVVSGQNATLTIQVANHTNPLVDVGALNVLDQLPAPLLVNGAAVSTCTGGTLSAVNGSATVSLTNATLPAAGCAITVPVVWPRSAADQCVNTSTTVTNTITPGALASGGQFSSGGGQVNTPATATLTCAETVLPPVAVNPVPTLGEWARLLMAGLLVLVAGGLLSRRQRLA